jgi:hypothetical protein
LENRYGDPKIGQVKAVRGKRHDYLAMILDYSSPGRVMVDMINYVKSMVEDFPEPVGNMSHPWNGTLFEVDDNGEG